MIIDWAPISSRLPFPWISHQHKEKSLLVPGPRTSSPFLSYPSGHFILIDFINGTAGRDLRKGDNVSDYKMNDRGGHGHVV